MTNRTLPSKIVILLFWAAIVFLSIELFTAGRQTYSEMRDTFVSAEPLRLATIELDDMERLSVESFELMRLTLTDPENGPAHQQKLPKLREEIEASWEDYTELLRRMPRDGKYWSSIFFGRALGQQRVTYINLILSMEAIENLDLALEGFSNAQYLENLNNDTLDFASNLAHVRDYLTDTDHPLLN